MTGLPLDSLALQTIEYASAGSMQLTPTATISSTSRASENASAAGSPARVRSPEQVIDSQQDDGRRRPGQQRLDPNQAGNGLQGQDVETGSGEELSRGRCQA